MDLWIVDLVCDLYQCLVVEQCFDCVGILVQDMDVEFGCVFYQLVDECVDLFWFVVVDVIVELDVCVEILVDQQDLCFCFYYCGVCGFKIFVCIDDDGCLCCVFDVLVVVVWFQ